METEYIEKLLNAKFSHLETKIENIQDISSKTLIQTTITNGRVTALETWQANTKGYWKAVNRIMVIVGTLLGIGVGAIATWLWH